MGCTWVKSIYRAARVVNGGGNESPRWRGVGLAREGEGAWGSGRQRPAVRRVVGFQREVILPHSRRCAKFDGQRGTAMKFLVTIEKDEAGYYVVECPALPGCVTQGKSRVEALANIREAILASLETRQRSVSA